MLHIAKIIVITNTFIFFLRIKNYDSHFVITYSTDALVPCTDSYYNFSIQIV